MRNTLHVLQELKEELELKLCVNPSMWTMHTLHDFKLKSNVLKGILVPDFSEQYRKCCPFLRKICGHTAGALFSFSSINIISFNNSAIFKISLFVVVICLFGLGIQSHESCHRRSWDLNKHSHDNILFCKSDLPFILLDCKKKSLELALFFFFFSS